MSLDHYSGVYDTVIESKCEFTKTDIDLFWLQFPMAKSGDQKKNISR